ncbi:MAG: hypothetical protein SGPRY_010545 [Prymnesium sp.]
MWGYEIMSEPRVRNISPEAVRDFYREGCHAVHAEDPRTPCIVGAAPFYNIHGLEGAYMPDVPNAIYAFNFFIPRKYVNGDATRKYRYPGQMQCCDAHEKEHALCCPGREGEDLSLLPCCASMVQVDRSFLERELKVALDFRKQYRVPIYMDQWSISRTSGSDRLQYVRDVLSLTQEYRVHWTYWQWRQRDYSQMAVVTMNADWDHPQLDIHLIDVLATVLGADRYLEYHDPPPPPLHSNPYMPPPEPAARSIVLMSSPQPSDTRMIIPGQPSPFTMLPPLANSSPLGTHEQGTLVLKEKHPTLMVLNMSSRHRPSQSSDGSMLSRVWLSALGYLQYSHITLIVSFVVLLSSAFLLAIIRRGLGTVSKPDKPYERSSRKGRLRRGPGCKSASYAPVDMQTDAVAELGC